MKHLNIMKYLFFTFSLSFSNILTSNNNSNLLEKIQGSWQALEDSTDNPALQFTVFRHDTCFHSSILRNNNEMQWDTSLVYFSNECISSDNQTIKKDINNTNGEYLIFEHIGEYPATECYWYEFISIDTLHLNYSERPREYQNLVRIKMNIEPLKMQVVDINPQKSIIYYSPNIPTKMYLEKGNEVEVLEEKGEWLHIR
jgi:hypothetical protein